QPDLALRLFWGLFVPLAPLVFLVAPGLWRNVCPLAAVNQIARGLGLDGGIRLSRGARAAAPVAGALLFGALIPLRKLGWDRNALYLAVFLSAMFGLALIGGFVFRGKSGWCTSICPMSQVERFYGKSPLAVVPHSHCNPC